MPNMSVNYQRPDHSLRKLRAEIRRVWPHREQNKGFVTGYKSKWNYSGHNADADGIAHAYDVGVDIEGDGTGLLPADAAQLAEYLRIECNPRFQYLIYDGRIAGNHTGWEWVAYTGASPHKDHIHISVVDLYWGDPVAVPASVYDSTASWGVVDHFTNKPSISVQAETIGEIMATLDQEDLENIAYYVWKYDQQGDTRQAWWYQRRTGETVWDEPMTYRGNTNQARTYLLRTNRDAEQLREQLDRIEGLLAAGAGK